MYSPVSVEDTLIFAVSLLSSNGPIVYDWGRSTNLRSPIVASSTVKLVSVFGVRLITSISNTIS